MRMETDENLSDHHMHKSSTFIQNSADSLLNTVNKNTQRMYRYIQQTAHRLDIQMKNVSNWREFFDNEAILNRHKFRDSCEEILFTGSPDLARRVEDILWRKCFYDIIQKLRQDRKLLQSDSTLRTIYDSHLNAAHSFYHHLLLRVSESVDFLISNATDWISQTSKFPEEIAYVEITRQEAKKLVLKLCQRCLLYLGDLARYQLDIENSEAGRLAERLYNEAILVFPDNGMPHNQLGTLKQQTGFNDFETAYHYFRCIYSMMSFDGAQENLKRTLNRNRLVHEANSKQYGSNSTDALEHFLIAFLDLCRQFLHERLHPDDYSNPCQSVIEKFVEILNAQKRVVQLIDVVELEKNEKIVLSENVMIKIFTMCIMMVQELRRKGSETLSAVIAFTFTLLSKLLDFVVKTLPVSLLGLSISNLLNKEDEKSLKKSDDSKKNNVQRVKRKRRRRRRKDFSDNSIKETGFCKNNSSGDTSASDLSEGELISGSIDSCSSTIDDSDDEICQTSTLLKPHHNSTHSSNIQSGQPDFSFRNDFYRALSFVNDHCYLATLKVVSDWLQYSDGILNLYAKDIPCIWKKYAKVFSGLPSDHHLLALLYHNGEEIDPELILELEDGARQSKCLPEDKALIGLPVFSEVHCLLDFSWDEHSSNAELLQFIVRLRSLNAFGNFLSKEELGIDQAQIMKTFAKQKLVHDVSKLQDEMTCKMMDEAVSDMPSFLIVDVQALCRHLSLIRSLVKSREFIVIIPIQVVQALDELKKYNPSAREATKFLEAEFQHKNRWLRLQNHQEFVDCDQAVDGKRKRKFNLDEWRFMQVVKCACFYKNKHSNNGVASILTSKPSKDSYDSLGTRITPAAVSLCEKMEIQINSVVEFYERWASKKKN